MALVLDATVGGASSNTYCTLAEAESYLEETLYPGEWADATNVNKNIALVMATRLLDEQIQWDGLPTDDTQVLQWPREYVTQKNNSMDYYDDDELPQWLKDATAEFAKLLLGDDTTADNELSNFTSLEVGPITLDMRQISKTTVLPNAVWDMCASYGVKISPSSGGNTLLRV